MVRRGTSPHTKCHREDSSLQQEGELGTAQAIAQSSLDIVEDPVYRSQIDDLLTAMQ